MNELRLKYNTEFQCNVNLRVEWDEIEVTQVFAQNVDVNK